MDKYVTTLQTPEKHGLPPTPRNIVKSIDKKTEISTTAEPWPHLKEYFTTKSTQDKHDGTFTATCQKCKPEIKTIQIYLSSLSNMRRHYERSHLHLLSNFKEACKIGSRRGNKRQIANIISDTTGDSPNKKQRKIGAWISNARLPPQQDCNKLFVSMMINEMLPLRLASSPYLHAWCQAHNPDRALPPGRTTVTKQVKDLYHESVHQLISHLNKVTYISTTADCWTSK